MKRPNNIQIELKYQINMPHKTAVQSTIELNDSIYIEQLLDGENTIAVYKKHFSDINNKTLNVYDSDIYKELVGNAGAHSQSIGVTGFPYMLPDGKFFLASGPEVTNVHENSKDNIKIDSKKINYVASISCMLPEKEIINSSDKLTYIAGFGKLLRKLNSTYNVANSDLRRVEFSVYNFGAELDVMLLDYDFNMYIVAFDLTYWDSFLNNLANNNDISSQRYKWSRRIPYAIWKRFFKQANLNIADGKFMSFQGMTCINDEIQNTTIMFSSEFEPKNYKTQPRFILSVPPTNSYRFDETESSDLQDKWTYIDLSNTSELDVAGYNTEFENIDYVSQTSVLLTVAYHAKNSKETTEFNKVYKISW